MDSDNISNTPIFTGFVGIAKKRHNLPVTWGGEVVGTCNIDENGIVTIDMNESVAGKLVSGLLLANGLSHISLENSMNWKAGG